MSKLVKKLAIAALPIVLYFAAFIYFEPYNYFGLKKSRYNRDSAIVRVRNFDSDPRNVIILGDSRMAHFDMDTVEEYVGESVSQLAFGGAGFNESMDLLEYALESNPDIHTIYFGVSFYTLNESYYKDRMSQIQTIASNPFAYMLNFNYNIEMLNEIKYFLKGEENVASTHHREWTYDDLYDENGQKRKYRLNLLDYADTIYGVCENYRLDNADVERYAKLAQECSEKGITLYTVLPPMDDSLRELVVDKLDIGGDIEYFINQVQPYSTVLNYEYTDSNPFTQEQFYDGFHLDTYSGLPVFTEMLFKGEK